MAEIRITPGGNTPTISANSQYNLASQLSAAQAMRPMDVRSGHIPIKRAVLYDSAIEQMSALSAADGRSAFSANGLIGAVDEYSIRFGSANNITSVMELYMEYEALGERRDPL